MYKGRSIKKRGKQILFTHNSIVNIEISKELTKNFHLLKLKVVCSKYLGYQIHFISEHKLLSIKSLIYKTANVKSLKINITKHVQGFHREKHKLY